MNLMIAGMVMRRRGAYFVSSRVRGLHYELPHGPDDSRHGDETEGSYRQSLLRLPTGSGVSYFPVRASSGIGACKGPHTAASRVVTHAHVRDRQGKLEN